MSLYDWVNCEVMFDEKPSEEVINNDEEFDKWLDSYQRKQREKYQVSKLRATSHGT